MTAWLDLWSLAWKEALPTCRHPFLTMAIHPAPASGGTKDLHLRAFPAHHYAKILPRDFLQAHFPTSRPSGRTPAAARHPIIHTNSLTHVHGSAVVRNGGTSAVCAVRGEFLHAADANYAPQTQAWLDQVAVGDASIDSADAMTDLGLLVPNIELATGCHPEYLPGSPPSIMAQNLAQRVLSLLRVTRLLHPEQLVIWADPPDQDDNDEDAMDTQELDKLQPRRRAMAFWTLYMDVAFLSLDGAAFPTAWSSILTALLTALLPEARWDNDRARVLCHPDKKRARKLVLNGFPMAMDFAIFSSTYGFQDRPHDLRPQILADPDDFEESCAPETATVVVDRGGAKILRIEKCGSTAVKPNLIEDMVHLAGECWVRWKRVCETACGSNEPALAE